MKQKSKDFKKFTRRKFKRQKRYNIIYRTLKIFNKFYEKAGDPEIAVNWRIRKPFFLMTFFFRRYIKRYYGRIRNNKMNKIFAMLKSKKSGSFFYLRYFQTLESLLSIFLTRIGVAKNPLVARDFIKAGKIFINNVKIKNPNYILQAGDLLSIDTSLIKDKRHRIYYLRRRSIYYYFANKWEVPKRFRYKWYESTKFYKRTLFQQKKYDSLYNMIKQYNLYLMIRGGKVLNRRLKKNFLKILYTLLLKKAGHKVLSYTKYKKKVTKVKLRRKFLLRTKRLRTQKTGRFKYRQFKPFPRLLGGGFSYRQRVKLNRFLLNVEYSRKINKFIYITPPIWSNINMYLLKPHKAVNIYYPNIIPQDMLLFFLDNFKKSVL